MESTAACAAWQYFNLDRPQGQSEVGDQNDHHDDHDRRHDNRDAEIYLQKLPWNPRAQGTFCRSGGSDLQKLPNAENAAGVLTRALKASSSIMKQGP